MSRLTRDGTVETVSRDQILRHERGQGSIHFPCDADHEQDWQPYPVDPYSAIRDDHTYIHTYNIDSSLKNLLTLAFLQQHMRCVSAALLAVFNSLVGGSSFTPLHWRY